MDYIKDIAVMVLSDCVSFYHTMVVDVRQLCETYTVLTAIDAIQFNSVIISFQSLTEVLREFHGRKKCFDEAGLVKENIIFYNIGV